MSVVVAIKYRDGVVLAADRQATSGNIKIDNASKLYKSAYSMTAIGMVGRSRDADLISCQIDDLMEYKDILDKVKIDKKYLVNIIVPKIFNILMRFNRAHKEYDIIELDSNFIIVSNEKLFKVFFDGAVLEYDSFVTAGCGNQLAQGYLESQDVDMNKLTQDEAVKLAKECIFKACKDDVFISNDYADILILNKSRKRSDKNAKKNR